MSRDGAAPYRPSSTDSQNAGSAAGRSSSALWRDSTIHSEAVPSSGGRQTADETRQATGGGRGAGSGAGGSIDGASANMGSSVDSVNSLVGSVDSLQLDDAFVSNVLDDVFSTTRHSGDHAARSAETEAWGLAPSLSSHDGHRNNSHDAAEAVPSR